MKTRDEVAETQNPSTAGGVNGAPPNGLDKEGFLKLDADAQMALWIKDMLAANRMLESGGLEQFSGQYVAFVDGQFAGAGRDSGELRMRVSQERNVHPEQMAVIFFPDEMVL